MAISLEKLMIIPLECVDKDISGHNSLHDGPCNVTQVGFLWKRRKSSFQQSTRFTKPVEIVGDHQKGAPGISGSSMPYEVFVMISDVPVLVRTSDLYKKHQITLKS